MSSKKVTLLLLIFGVTLILTGRTIAQISFDGLDVGSSSEEDLISYKTCIVHAAGPKANGDILIQLTDTDGQFSEVWYKAYPDVKKEILATALSAIVTNRNVKAGIPILTSLNDTIHELYIIE